MTQLQQQMPTGSALQTFRAKQLSKIYHLDYNKMPTGSVLQTFRAKQLSKIYHLDYNKLLTPVLLILKYKAIFN